ncbi:tRNA lysidine(34) synthetase TilS [Shewanella aestuarii]|uniref:tRNA(Ile)-lysidine synthase n=1 Tax=Shewanella aestuarii TaxID=1028752 RepID=A0A6G9QK82_9GAMM|nr:tRNA lysidine(34) synthetase TilS [Shewanella aestuarii]QIR14936.1 tRNA lysidine(34) synthetase TilS [Shewanella aestuarii]
MLDINKLVEKIHHLYQACLEDVSYVDNTQTASPKLVLAYSGGVDSQVLAFGLSQFKLSYPAIDCLLVHVHHGLSKNAEEWAAHCVQQASSYQLPICIERVHLTIKPRQSLEAIAREARYQAIENHLIAGDILLTAHHQDDQLETLLLAIKRGQGPKGLAAMGEQQSAQSRSQPGLSYHKIRPLLAVSRDDIETFAALQNLSHIEDESNQDDSFDRNFLRLNIIPLLKQRWPSIAQTGSRSAALIAEQQQLIDEETRLRLPSMISHSNVNSMHYNGVGLNLDSLATQTPAWQTQLLRAFIFQQGFAAPSQIQLQQMLIQLVEAKEDANIHIEFSGAVLKRYAQYAYVLDKSVLTSSAIGVDALASAKIQVWLNKIVLDSSLSDLSIVLPYFPWQLQLVTVQQGNRLALPKDINQVRIQYGAAGSIKCLPQFEHKSRQQARELKKLWHEAGIAPWRRQQVPLLFYGDKLVAALGLWLDKKYLAQQDEIGLNIY